MHTLQRPRSLSAFLLKEALLKDDLQREKELYDDHPVRRDDTVVREGSRRASFRRTCTEGGTPRRASSLSPTRPTHPHLRRLFPYPGPCEDVSSSIAAPLEDSTDDEDDTYFGRSKHKSLPAAAHTGGWLGWFRGEGAEGEAMVDDDKTRLDPPHSEVSHRLLRKTTWHSNLHLQGFTPRGRR